MTEEKSTKTLVLLCSRYVPSSREQMAHQERAMTICKARGIVPDVVWGTDPDMVEYRKQLFSVSGIRHYPQFFLKHPIDQSYEFLGDFKAIEDMNDFGEFTTEILKCTTPSGCAAKVISPPESPTTVSKPPVSLPSEVGDDDIVTTESEFAYTMDQSYGNISVTIEHTTEPGHGNRTLGLGEAEQSEPLSLGVTKLQSIVRGFLTRKCIPKQEAKRMATKGSLKECLEKPNDGAKVEMEQKNCDDKGKPTGSLLSVEIEESLRVSCAVIMLQSLIRGVLTRRQLLRQKRRRLARKLKKDQTKKTTKEGNKKKDAKKKRKNESKSQPKDALEDAKHTVNDSLAIIKIQALVRSFLIRNRRLKQEAERLAKQQRKANKKLIRERQHDGKEKKKAEKERKKKESPRKKDSKGIKKEAKEEIPSLKEYIARAKEREGSRVLGLSKMLSERTIEQYNEKPKPQSAKKSRELEEIRAMGLTRMLSEKKFNQAVEPSQ